MFKEEFKLDTQQEKSNLEKFENIKTPTELFSFMNHNIHYGFIGREDNKIYSPDFSDWGVGEQPEIKLQKTEDLLASGYGNCWEQTELEKKWFTKNNYRLKTFLLMFDDKVDLQNPAHSFLAYKEGEIWNWFENAYGDNNGIHEYRDILELILDVSDKIKENAKRNGASDEMLKKAKFYEYTTSLDNCSDASDFLSKVKKEKEIVL